MTQEQNDEARMKRIEDMLRQIHDFVFIGNGRESLVAQVAANTQRTRLLFWFGSVVVIAVVTGAVGIWMKV